MKKILFASLAALTALTVAPAAFAASGDYGRGGYGDRYDGRDYRDNNFRDGRGGDARAELFRLEQRIDWGVRNGSINGREARGLKSDVRDIRDMQAHFWRTGGMNPRERAIIDRRIDNLRAAVWRESRDRDYRGGGRW